MPYAGGPQRALGRNSNSNDTACDENADTTTPTTATTPAVPSKNLTRDTAAHQKPLLQMTGAAKPSIASGPKRMMLIDKSNRHDRTSSISSSKYNEKDTIVRKRQHYSSSEIDHTQKKTCVHSTQAPPPPVSTDTKTLSHLVNPSDQQQQQQHSSSNTSNAITTTTTKAATAIAGATEVATTLKDFFDDNKLRYKPTSNNDRLKTPMQPTPIIPITVPDRMKPRLREKYLSSRSSTKRSHESMCGPSGHLSATLIRQNVGKRDDQHSIEKDDTSEPHTTITTTTTNISSLHRSPLRHSTPVLTRMVGNDQQPKTDLVVDRQRDHQAKEPEEQQEHSDCQNILQTKTTSQRDDHTATQDRTNELMLVANYADEINAYLRATEDDTMADPAYIKIQHEVTWRMRDILVDWVTGIHYVFNFLPETFFLTVNIIDRFLSKRDVSLAKLQLVGITCLFVATKFEESIAPPIRQFLYMTDNTVSEDELLKSERYILQILDFKLCYPHPLQFLRRCTMTGTFESRPRILAKYFIEIPYIDHRFLGTRPSLVAASSLWLSLRIICEGDWTPELIETSGYTVLEMKPTVELILDYLSQPIKNTAFFKKWASRRMMKVSVFVRDWVDRFYS